MQKKILKYQLSTLFIITTLNLIYFNYRETLPDNYYEISSNNSSINLVTYYFFTFLANFGYWCGIWITLSFVIFALLNTFLLAKRSDFKSALILAPLLPLTLLLSFLVLPESLGEGLFYLIHNNFNFLSLFVSITFVGLCFFYLVSEKHFFDTFKYLYRVLISLPQNLKSSSHFFQNFNRESLFIRLNIFKVKLLSHIKPTSTINTSTRPSLPTKQPLVKAPTTRISTSNPPSHAITPSPVVLNDAEDDSDSLNNDTFHDDEDTDSDFDELSDSLDEESIDDTEVDYVGRDVPAQDLFFESEELIDCIAPKHQHNNHSKDPDNQYFERIARSIEEKLKEFNINAQILNVLKGPVVDTFELELGAGVKVASVNNKADDLSLALMGAPIRIVYPMKGKSTIGIEVPRNPRDVIYLDEVLKSPLFQNPNYKLPIAMGKDAYGDPAVIDLAATPHLLVAGTTGAGKSVFINTLLVSLIIKFSPKKLRLIMLDPKQLELALYQRLPHLIMPVVTDAQIASVALMWAIEEMERRYSLLRDFGVKNIEGFNKKITVAGADLICKINKYYPDAEIEHFEMPYIVVVVDEFADLMLSKSGKAIETSISRLAAKARASGIHIVLATQRPSTDIITGVIKANFPTRVSFRVFTNIDSRVILDGTGAEKLLGKGDMLFKQGIDILRMHSAYVNEDEIESLVDKLATLPSQYDSDAMEFIQNNGVADTDTEGLTTDGEGGLKDDKYEEAVRCVATHRLASASFLQRRLGVGYNRAANLIEEMERHGVVGPAQGSKPRKVLVPPPSDSTP
jgi:DNA segregation ATPase FtsK/SpoIIIE, S-DNA-T family